MPPIAVIRAASCLADLAELLPPAVADAIATVCRSMDRRWHGRFLPDAVLVGPEARGSSPVRIVRDDGNARVAGHRGLYPSAKERAMPAESSAPRWMASARPGPSSARTAGRRAESGNSHNLPLFAAGDVDARRLASM